MKFKLSTSGFFYTNKKLIKKLKSIGFEFKPFRGFEGNIIDVKSICGSPELEINSLQDLVDFSDKFGELIVSKGKIRIYNDVD